MNRTILYYPTIDVPKKSWLSHALLYWDEVSSIVPKSWDDKMLVELSPHIHYLIGEKQFRPIKPEVLISAKDNWEAFHQFKEEFREIVTSKEFQNFIQRKHKSLYRVHINKVEGDKVARVHSDKASTGIINFLEEEGLAKRNREDPDWLMFEKNTALLYMSLLAKYLAEIDSEQTIIGTDYIAYEKFNFRRVSQDKGFPVVSFSLNNVLPTPKSSVTLKKIIEFKRKRSDNLLHFKRLLSDFQTKISKAESQSELKEVAITFQETLLTGVKDLKAVMGDSAIESTFKTLKSLINLKSPTLITSAGIFANEKLNIVNVPFGFEAMGLATVGALELTCNFIEARNKQRVKLRESPFSYIYQAQRTGILDKYR